MGSKKWAGCADELVACGRGCGGRGASTGVGGADGREACVGWASVHIGCAG